MLSTSSATGSMMFLSTSRSRRIGRDTTADVPRLICSGAKPASDGLLKLASYVSLLQPRVITGRKTLRATTTDNRRTNALSHLAYPVRVERSRAAHHLTGTRRPR
jgi:hypothetical protein